MARRQGLPADLDLPALVALHGSFAGVESAHSLPDGTLSNYLGRPSRRALRATCDAYRLRHVAPGATERWCTDCRCRKPITAFGPSRAGTRGRKARCRTCEATVARTQRANATDDQAQRRREVQTRSRVKAAYGEAGLAALDRIRSGAGCDVCGGRTARMAIDHDHDDGHVRGVLCKDCNLVLGWMDDNPTRLRALAAYLESA